MKWWAIGLFLLMACTEVQPEIAPAVILIDEGCKAAQTIGESCGQTCECLKPAKCLDGICSLTSLEDGSPCAKNQQCVSGYCENNFCITPENTAHYECNRICKDNYNNEPKDCSTVCRSR